MACPSTDLDGFLTRLWCAGSVELVANAPVIRVKLQPGRYAVGDTDLHPAPAGLGDDFTARDCTKHDVPVRRFGEDRRLRPVDRRSCRWRRSPGVRPRRLPIQVSPFEFRTAADPSTRPE